VIPIGICTVDRPQGYVHRTIESLLASDYGVELDCQIHLFVGCPDPSYLARYGDEPRITVHPLPISLCQEMWNERIHPRFNRNYLRCLRHITGISPAVQGVIVFEDDAVLRPDWFGRLRESIAELETWIPDPYVLAFYYAGNVRLSPRGQAFCSYIAETCYGTQAMYYPLPSALGFADFLAQHIHKIGAADIILRHWCVQHQNLYATIRCLAQHIGFETTGLAGHMHQAMNYHEPWPQSTGEQA
jgi:hypothetical protein